MSTKTPSPTDDLDWLAFCYAAGDLDATATERFEARLAEEQPAREALARAVDLTQTVAAAEVQPCLAVPVGTIKTHWQTRVSWMAIGGLAAALMIMAWTSVVGPSWKQARNTLAARSHQHLAQAWTKTRQQIAAPTTEEVWSDFDLSLEADGWLADSQAVDSLAVEVELHQAPSWMMAAVYASSRPSDSPSTETTERLEN